MTSYSFNKTDIAIPPTNKKVDISDLTCHELWLGIGSLSSST